MMSSGLGNGRHRGHKPPAPSQEQSDGVFGRLLLGAVTMYNGSYVLHSLWRHHDLPASHRVTSMCAQRQTDAPSGLAPVLSGDAA